MEAVVAKAKKIRLLILDVDGVLTNGVLYYSPQEAEPKAFHVHDGQGMKLLQQAGIPIAVITSRHSPMVTKRMQELGVEFVYQNQHDKSHAYAELKQKLQISDAEIAYVGDDLPDLALIRRVGLGITVADAPAIMHEFAHWVTEKKGGHGAVREVCDLIIRAQDQYQNVIQAYL